MNIIGYITIDGSAATIGADGIGACISDPRGRSLAFLHNKNGVETALHVSLKDGPGTDLGPLTDDSGSLTCLPLSSAGKGVVMLYAQDALAVAGLYSSAVEVKLMAP